MKKSQYPEEPIAFALRQAELGVPMIAVRKLDMNEIERKAKILKVGSRLLSIWSGINFLLAALILISVVIFKANSPLLVLVFDQSEIANLSAKVIASLNALTILYNSSAVVLSVLVWMLIRKSLIANQKWAFWVLLFVIGFVEVMSFIASVPIGNARWQLYVIQSALYVVGIGLSGYAIFKPKKPTLADGH